MELFRFLPGIMAICGGSARLFRPRYTGILAATLSIFSSGVATGNAVGNDTQNFSPVAIQPDYVSVHSAKSLAAGEFHLGLYMNHARNTLPFAVERTDQRAGNGLTTTDVVIGYGLNKRFALGLALPFVVQQDIDTDATHSEFAKTGNSEVRAVAHWRILDAGSFRFALAGTVGMDRTLDNPNVGDGTTGIIEAIVDQEVGRFRWAANLGFKGRTAQKPVEGALVDPIAQELLGSVAVGYRMNLRWDALAEMFSGRAMNAFRNETDRARASAEALAALRYKFGDNTRLTMGVGGELLHGIATPDVRFLAGINQLIQPRGKASVPLLVQKRKQPASSRRPTLRSEVTEADDFAATSYEETTGEYDDLPMVPAMASVPQRAADEVLVLRNVNFAFDSDFEVIEGGLLAMQKLADHLAKSPFDTVLIEGHTCRLGGNAYNENLSFRRARSIRNHLIAHYGFAPGKIIAVGFGEGKPAATNAHRFGRMLNRRVEFKIYRSQQLTAGVH